MHCTFFITINDLFKKVLIISHMKSFYLEQCHSYDTQCLKIRKKWPLIVSLAVSNISFYQRAPKSLTRLQSLTNIFEVLFRTHNKKVIIERTILDLSSKHLYFMHLQDPKGSDQLEIATSVVFARTIEDNMKKIVIIEQY